MLHCVENRWMEFLRTTVAYAETRGATNPSNWTEFGLKLEVTVLGNRKRY
jgi:hypothetical protein